jgi:hypothetical protein
MMTKRDPHPDNELIDQMQEDAMGAGGQQGRARSLGTDNGTRAELEQAGGGDIGVTRVTGEYKDGQDAMKGEKTRAAIRSNQSKESPEG